MNESQGIKVKHKIDQTGTVEMPHKGIAAKQGDKSLPIHVWLRGLMYQNVIAEKNCG